MKEKVIFILSLICFIGIMWFSISNATKTTNIISSVSEKITTPSKESNYTEHIDNLSTGDIINMDITTLESNIPSINTCSLKPIETDLFTFGDAFQHYRKCLGSDSSFQWKGNTYSTLLSEEIIIFVADSMRIKVEKGTNNHVSEIR